MEIHQCPLSDAGNSTLWGHQYIVATVKLPTGPTYCRFDVYKKPNANVSDVYFIKFIQVTSWFMAHSLFRSYIFP